MRPNRGHFFILLLVGSSILGIGELMVRFLAPQPIMVPRYAFSEKYNTSLPPGTTIRNEKPGVYQFFYTINDEGYRGPIVSADSARDCIIILGDSFSLGVGVQDGEEYPAQMRKVLGGRRDVVNLGVGGWGLSQQIRRYYDFGQSFRPRTVILQFCGNDPVDSMIYPVTRWENEDFTFHPVQSGGKRYAKYLSSSPLQRSQLYNLVRNQVWLLTRHFASQKSTQTDRPDHKSTDTAENAYIDLLVPFAAALQREEVELVFIYVEESIEQFPKILATVKGLAETGQLYFVDVNPWLEDLVDYASPEGHAWGTEAHARIGQGLARWVTAHLPPPNL